MSTFVRYSKYYDRLYADKDYEAETAYTLRLLNRDRAGIASILELGCGTGVHAALLAGRGLEVRGIDLSEEMLAHASGRAASLDAASRSRVSFGLGDARTVRTGASYDAVMSLFHMMSYQTQDTDLAQVCETAEAHLRPGGFFLFDFWYGPAVLSQGPSRRRKQLEDDQVLITRLAEPTVLPAQNIVEVRYTVDVQDKQSAKVESVVETHRMRFLFLPEVEAMLDASGFDLVLTEEWLSSCPPSPETWSVCALARRR